MLADAYVAFDAVRGGLNTAALDALESVFVRLLLVIQDPSRASTLLATSDAIVAVQSEQTRAEIESLNDEISSLRTSYDSERAQTHLLKASITTLEHKVTKLRVLAKVRSAAQPRARRWKADFTMQMTN